MLPKWIRPMLVLSLKPKMALAWLRVMCLDRRTIFR